MRYRFFDKSKSIYTKLILSYLVIILLLTFILTSSLYFNYEKAALDIMFQSNMKLLSQISYSTNYMNDLGSGFCKSEILNSDIISIINSNTKDIFNLGNTLNKLHSTIMSASYIHSVYIYNRKLDLFISSYGSKIANTDSFFDHDIGNIIKKADSSANISQLVPIPRKLLTGGSTKNPQYSNIYTYILFDYASYIDTKDKIKGAIILNISQNWLKNTISSMDPVVDKSNGDIFIIDKNGTVVSHPSDNMFLRDLSSERYIMKVLTSGTDSGFFIDKVNNERYVVTYTASKTLDWKFVSLTPYASITGIISRIRVVTVVFCTIILLLGLFFSAFISKRIYSPISTLVNDVNDKLHIPSTPERQLNEINFLSEAFSQVLDKAESLEAIYQNNQLLLKNDFLKNLLIGNLSSDMETTVGKLSELGIKLTADGHFILCILKIDNYRHFITDIDEKNRVLYKYAICNIASRIAGNNYTNEVVDMGDNNICIVLQLGSGPIKPHERSNLILADIVHQIQDEILKHTKISISAAAGYISKGIDKISTSYLVVSNLSLYRIIFGHKCLILPDNMNGIENEDFTFPSAKEKQLLDFIRLGDAEQAKDMYYKIVDAISKYSYDNIMSSIVHLAVNIYSCISSIEKSSSCKFSVDFNSLNKSISSKETLDEINQMFTGLFYKIANILNDSRNKKSDKIINNVISIIQSNFYDKNLCLNSIASTMKMSTVYLGKIFKDYTSKSIAEFITDLRMEKVKHLLDTTSYPLGRILEKTGFTKSNYFYTTFKKHFGVSLSEYRLAKSAKK